MISPDGKVNWTALYRRQNDIVPRTVAGETILVPVRGELAQLQEIFVLNPVAEHIWRAMDGTRDLAGIHAMLLEAFDVEEDIARQDLLEFVADLEDAGLLVAVSRSDPAEE